MGGRAKRGAVKKSTAPESITPEQALDVLLHWYVARQDWFMAERLAHDLNRLHGERSSESEQEDSDATDTGETEPEQSAGSREG